MLNKGENSFEKNYDNQEETFSIAHAIAPTRLDAPTMFVLSPNIHRVGNG